MTGVSGVLGLRRLQHPEPVVRVRHRHVGEHQVDGTVPCEELLGRRRGPPPRTPAREGPSSRRSRSRACGSSSTTRMPGRLIAPRPAPRARPRRGAQPRPEAGPRREAHRRGGCRSPARADAERAAVRLHQPLGGRQPQPVARAARAPREHGRTVGTGGPAATRVIPGPLSVTSSTASSPSRPAYTTTRAPGRPAEYFTALERGSGQWTGPAGPERPRPPAGLELSLDQHPVQRGDLALLEEDGAHRGVQLARWALATLPGAAEPEQRLDQLGHPGGAGLRVGEHLLRIRVRHRLGCFG